MLFIAASGFWIHEIRLLGLWSPIHLLSILVLVTVPLAVWHAHNHRVKQHRKAMISLYILALIGAGIFTLLPGRVMHEVVFGGVSSTAELETFRFETSSALQSHERPFVDRRLLGKPGDSAWPVRLVMHIAAQAVAEQEILAQPQVGSAEGFCQELSLREQKLPDVTRPRAARASDENADAAVRDIMRGNQRHGTDGKPARMLVAAHHSGVERRQLLGKVLPEGTSMQVEFGNHLRSGGAVGVRRLSAP